MKVAGPISMALSLLVALGASGCKTSTPDARDDIKFSHGAHLRAGASCTRCHSGVERVAGAPTAEAAPTDEAAPEAADAPDTETDAAVESTESSDSEASTDSERPARDTGAFPSEDTCKACHTEEAERRCTFCHQDGRSPSGYAYRAPRGLLFDHLPHIERVRGGCMGCHGHGQEFSTLASFNPAIPPMAACTDECHADAMAELRCDMCHTDLHAYDMQGVTAFRHGAGWLRRHGSSPRSGDAFCAQCHDDTFCARCHQAAPGPRISDLEPMNVTRAFIHRGDFLARHGNEARVEEDTCQQCHGIDFCDGCHTARGVGGSVAPGSPHPPGWLDPASPRGHARAGRRDILTCAACHESDAATTCTPCHRSGGVAGNPHPPGFGVGLDQTQHAVCLVCHRGRP